MLWLKPVTLTLIPILAFQGYRVKKNIIRLAEPDGCRKGITNKTNETNKSKTLSILILGDSAGAGVGVQHQDEALLGSIVKPLSQDFQISYCLEAQTGRTTQDVLAVLKKMPNQHFDIVITSLGVNDVTKLISVKTWVTQQKQLYSNIEEKFSPQLVLVTAVPPMQHFPALPNPLAWLFGQYATAMNKKLRSDITQKTNYHLLPFDLLQFRQLNLNMAEDGFHPSKEIYQLWANAMLKIIQQHFISRTEPKI